MFGRRYFGGGVASGGGGASAEQVWEYQIENGLSAADLLRVLAAVAAGKSTIVDNGGGTATVEFQAVDSTDVRVSAEMDGSERTSVTVTPDNT